MRQASAVVLFALSLAEALDLHDAHDQVQLATQSDIPVSQARVDNARGFAAFLLNRINVVGHASSLLNDGVDVVVILEVADECDNDALQSGASTDPDLRPAVGELAEAARSCPMPLPSSLPSPPLRGWLFANVSAKNVRMLALEGAACSGGSSRIYAASSNNSSIDGGGGTRGSLRQQLQRQKHTSLFTFTIGRDGAGNASATLRYYDSRILASDAAEASPVSLPASHPDQYGSATPVASLTLPLAARRGAGTGQASEGGTDTDGSTSEFASPSQADPRALSVPRHHAAALLRFLEHVAFGRAILSDRISEQIDGSGGREIAPERDPEFEAARPDHDSTGDTADLPFVTVSSLLQAARPDIEDEAKLATGVLVDAWNQKRLQLRELQAQAALGDQSTAEFEERAAAIAMVQDDIHYFEDPYHFSTYGHFAQQVVSQEAEAASAGRLTAPMVLQSILPRQHAVMILASLIASAEIALLKADHTGAARKPDSSLITSGSNHRAAAYRSLTGSNIEGRKKLLWHPAMVDTILGEHAYRRLLFATESPATASPSQQRRSPLQSIIVEVLMGAIVSVPNGSNTDANSEDDARDENGRDVVLHWPAKPSADVARSRRHPPPRKPSKRDREAAPLPTSAVTLYRSDWELRHYYHGPFASKHEVSTCADANASVNINKEDSEERRSDGADVDEPDADSDLRTSAGAVLAIRAGDGWSDYLPTPIRSSVLGGQIGSNVIVVMLHSGDLPKSFLQRPTGEDAASGNTHESRLMRLFALQYPDLSFFDVAFPRKPQATPAAATASKRAELQQQQQQQAERIATSLGIHLSQVPCLVVVAQPYSSHTSEDPLMQQKKPQSFIITEIAKRDHRSLSQALRNTIGHAAGVANITIPEPLKPEVHVIQQAAGFEADPSSIVVPRLKHAGKGKQQQPQHQRVQKQQKPTNRIEQPD